MSSNDEITARAKQDLDQLLEKIRKVRSDAKDLTKKLRLVRDSIHNLQVDLTRTHRMMEEILK